MDLAVLSDIEVQVSLIVQGLDGHYWPGNVHIWHSSFCWEAIQNFYSDKYDVGEDEYWYPVEREAVYDTSYPFLDHSDYELYLWDMFIGSC